MTSGRTLLIHPHQGVNGVRFGMSRAEVARALGATPKRVKGNRFSLVEIDIFETLGVKVLYDESDKVNAITFTRGFGVELEYDGYRLTGAPAREVREWALLKDPQLDREFGFTSKALGLGMSADWIDEPDLDTDLLKEPASVFIVFRPGYYEEESARMVAAGLVPPEGIDIL
jgi:hypothetical protein